MEVVNKKARRRLRRKTKKIENLILKDSKTLGYRAFRKKFDNLRPFFHTGAKRRKQMLERYGPLKKIAASAVKNHFRDDFSILKRNPKKQRKLRDEMSTGQCDLCKVKLTRGRKAGYQPWHRGTLEHVLDHDLGGPLLKTELAVLCNACNKAFDRLKIEVIGGGGSLSERKSAVYDFFIFKQLIILSQKATARDFEGEYQKFWKHRFDIANKGHTKMKRDLKLKADRGTHRDTVYWTLDCFNHSHCRHCGACHSTRSSHDQGHNIPYLMD